jgi:hypothetical protein
MTDEKLKGIAAQAANMAKTESQRNSSIARALLSRRCGTSVSAGCSLSGQSRKGALRGAPKYVPLWA